MKDVENMYLDTPIVTVYGVDVSPVPAPYPSPPNILYITGEIYAGAKNGRTSCERAVRLHLPASPLLICGMTNWASHIRDMATLLNQAWRVDGSARVMLRFGSRTRMGCLQWRAIGDV